MDHIDSFLESNKQENKSQNSQNKVLIFCNDKAAVALIKKQMNGRKLGCAFTEIPALPTQNYYKAILAISTNDLDNILICQQAKKGSVSHILAVCNNKMYANIFDEFDIQNVFYNIQDALEILISVVERW